MPTFLAWVPYKKYTLPFYLLLSPLSPLPLPPLLHPGGRRHLYAVRVQEYTASPWPTWAAVQTRGHSRKSGQSRHNRPVAACRRCRDGCYGCHDLRRRRYGRFCLI